MNFDTAADDRRQLTLSRREAVKAGVFLAAAAGVPLARRASAESAYPNRLAESRLPKPFTLPFRRIPVAEALPFNGIEDRFDITMSMFQVDMIPGYRTTVFGYNGSVPGPTIRAVAGRRTKVRMTNLLPVTHPYLNYAVTTSTHLHGFPSLPQYDGYASDLTQPGETKDYVYDRAVAGRTMWYHDHAHHHTAENVYMGLAGQYHVVDPVDEALPLPKGEYDVAIMLGDVMFQADGNLLFSYADDSGHWGDVNVVNGVPWPVMKVAKRRYRFRICSGAAARSFQLSLDNGAPMIVIGTDSGLVPAPISTTSLRTSSGERYEVVIDFSKYAVGTKIVMRNTSPKNNVNFTHSSKVMMFEVTGDSFDPSNNAVPDVLRPDNAAMLASESSSVANRVIRTKRQGGEWTINGHTWADVEASGYTLTEAKPVEGTSEIWTFVNDHGGWFHPMHLHLVEFRVLSRNGKPPRPYERGPKDTVYVGENEIVRVLAHFEGSGRYMIHCHNVIHEDHDMMSQFEVLPAHGTAPDPFSAAPIPIAEAGPL